MLCNALTSILSDTQPSHTRSAVLLSYAICHCYIISCVRLADGLCGTAVHYKLLVLWGKGH